MPIFPTSSGAAAASVVRQKKVVTMASLVSTGLIIPTDGTTPQIGEGEELMSQAFVPTRADSRISLQFIGSFDADGFCNVSVALFQSGVADALNWDMNVHTGAANVAAVPIAADVAAGSVAARTYSVRYGNDTPGQNVFVNNQFGSAGRRMGYVTLIITEYAP